MKTVKKIAKALYFLSSFIAFIYFLLAAYSIICLTTGWFVEIKASGSYFNILFPFTQSPILIGENNLPYIIFDFLMVFTLYGIFFMLLYNVFRTFSQHRLFIKQNIKKLKWFYMCNLIVPSAATLLAYIFATIGREVVLLIMLHFILGIFAYFFSEIFKQGLNLQNEQDLII